jgi:hypothetical protein
MNGLALHLTRARQVLVIGALALTTVGHLFAAEISGNNHRRQCHQRESFD